MKKWLAWSLLLTQFVAAKPPVVIASKLGAEPLVLSEMMAQLLEASGISVQRKLSLGPTEICFPALRSGQIDLYVEYTGTGLQLILKENLPKADALESFLHLQRRFREQYQVEWLPPFGFNNTYVLAISQDLAQKRGLSKLSQLSQHTDLRAAFDFQFLNKPDEYPGLAREYSLKFASLTPSEHSLVYQAMRQGKVDILDAYSTDAELQRYGLVALQDDREYFPLFHAAPLVRQGILTEYPELPKILAPLAFALDEKDMQQLNLQVLEGRSPAQVAAQFLKDLGHQPPVHQPPAARRPDLLPLALQHLGLSVGAVTLALLLGLPAAILIYTRPRLARLGLALASMIQTIPGIALLAFFVALPGLGLGVRSAMLALFLYALLPILRNAVTGLQQVDPLLREAAQGLGMRPWQVLWWVELPLAFPSMMAGLRTAAVIAVGSAPLAAFVGAGGLGVPIVTGLQLNDPSLVLWGALPSAGLALLVDGLLGLWEGKVKSSVTHR